VTTTAPAAPIVPPEVAPVIRGRLDAAEKLAPRRGQLDLGAYVRGTRDAGSAGGVLDYTHRISPSTALFGEASAGYGWGATPGLEYKATTGLRMRF